MTNSPKRYILSLPRILTCSKGFVLLAVVCLLLSQGAFADPVTVTGMNDATNYADTDIIDNLGKAQYEHTGTISGTSSLTVSAPQNHSDYRQWLKGANGSYSFTGPINVNGGQLLITNSKLSTKTINLNGGDMYVMYSDCLPHDAVVNVGSGTMLDVESGGNNIVGATINVASGGSFRLAGSSINNASEPVTLNIAGTGRPSSVSGRHNAQGAIVGYHGNADLFLHANINLTDDATIFLNNMSTDRQFILRGKLNGSSTLTLASDNAGRWITFQGGDTKMDLSAFSGNFVVDCVKGRFWSDSLGTGSNITVQNSATAFFNNTTALNNYNGSFTVNGATIELEAAGKLNNLSGDANGKVSFGSKTLTLNNTSNTTFNGKLDGTGAITKNGSGELTLTHNISGVNLTSKAGTLVLGTANNNINIGSSSIIKADGGAVRVDGNVVVSSGYLSAFGTWTGNGSIKVNSGGVLRINNGFKYDTGITLNGGILFNDGDNNSSAKVTFESPITVSAPSYIQCGWSNNTKKGEIHLKGSLHGSGSLTVNKDSSMGWIYFEGEGDYTGTLILKGKIVTGATGKGTEAAPASTTPYLGSGEIQLDGGLLLNNDSYWDVPNTINVVSASSIRAGYSKPFTFSGAIKGSGMLTIANDNNWIVMKTHSDNNTFTGDVKVDYSSDSSQGRLRLAAQQPFGSNAGTGEILGTLDMNGFNQQFKGLLSDGTKGVISNGATSQSTLTLDTTSENNTYNGVIKDNIALNITGTGTQTFANNGSNFTGNVVIDGGTVKGTTAHKSYTTTDFGAFTTTGGRTITVNSGAELVLGTNDVIGGCSISYFNDNSMRVILNGGKLSGTNNNPLYNATFQNGAEVYGNNNRDVYRSFWLMGTNTVSCAEDGETPENPVQFNGASGVIFVLDSAVLNVADVTRSDASDLVVNVILGNKSKDFVTNNSLTKTGAGTLELTKANEYTSGTTISEGVLKFTDAAVVANGPITVGEDGTLEYNLSSGKTQLLTIFETDDSNNKIKSTGKVVKTGDGTLQICTSAAGQVDATSFVVSSGRLDMKEYFTGSLEVESDATMSPGNSIGKLTVDGDFNLNGGTLLMEVAGPTVDDSDQLIVTNGSLIFGEGATILLDFVNGMSPNAEFAVVIDAPNSAENWVNYVDASYFTDLSYAQTGGRWVLSGRIDANAVPEPSTWALLALGVVVWSATACRRFHNRKRR
ncbi:MAG: autotransporter-associated beta strand repeat-containing protein [Thermoguttaceae bacterium]|nr:autotransporter-associated beta strand repeat-containing protein [Thermoguttaceae bacterium]